MKIQEYVGKGLLREHGLYVPKSLFVKREDIDSEGLSQRIIEIGFPQVLKSQVLVGGRMKAGGVIIAKNLEESMITLRELVNKDIKGEIPEGVLIEEFVMHDKELYFGITIDRTNRNILMIYSEFGGIDIEEASRMFPNKVLKTYSFNDLPEEFRETAKVLLDIFKKFDLTLLEINPIGVTKRGYVMLDTVMHVDDNALFRQSWAIEQLNGKENDMVLLGGSYGVIGCGAGIVMATIDMLKEFGFEPANFYDVGGGATRENVFEALENVSKVSKKIVLNIFGGITDCLEVAEAIVSFKKEHPDFKLFLRISGNNEEEARELLNDVGLKAVSDMNELIMLIQNEEGNKKELVENVLLQ